MSLPSSDVFPHKRSSDLIKTLFRVALTGLLNPARSAQVIKYLVDITDIRKTLAYFKIITAQY